MTGPGGVPVKGSRYAPNKRRFRRRFFPRPARPAQDDGKTGDSSAGPTSEGEGQNGTSQPRPRRRRQHRRPDTQPQTEVRAQCTCISMIIQNAHYHVGVRQFWLMVDSCC